MSAMQTRQQKKLRSFMFFFSISTRSLTAIELPTQYNAGGPGLRVQTNIPGNQQPIKCIDNNQLIIVRHFISGEQLRTILKAASRCEIVIDVTLDVHVIAGDTLLMTSMRAALGRYL